MEELAIAKKVMAEMDAIGATIYNSQWSMTCPQQYLYCRGDDDGKAGDEDMREEGNGNDKDDKQQTPIKNPCLSCDSLQSQGFVPVPTSSSKATPSKMGGGGRFKRSTTTTTSIS